MDYRRFDNVIVARLDKVEEILEQIKDVYKRQEYIFERRDLSDTIHQ